MTRYFVMPAITDPIEGTKLRYLTETQANNEEFQTKLADEEYASIAWFDEEGAAHHPGIGGQLITIQPIDLGYIDPDIPTAIALHAVVKYVFT